jgi:hypothetical protein
MKRKKETKMKKTIEKTIESKKPGKFEREQDIVFSILAKGKENITHDDRMVLLRIYQVPFHDDGKIEQIFSCDSSCNNCSFCQKIRENSKNNPLVICNYCYDNEQESRWYNVRNRHGLQLLIMSSVEFTREELATLFIFNICRFNSSGDIENVTMAKNYINIAYSHPAVKFALWAKNVSPVITATDILGKPENCVYIQSSIIINKPAKKAKYFDYVFTVYVTEEALQKALVTGAGECNGKKCKDCGFKCYMDTWKDISNGNIAELLRFPKGKEKILLPIIEKALAEKELL